MNEISNAAAMLELNVEHLGWTSTRAYKAAVDKYIDTHTATNDAKANLDRVRVFLAVPNRKIKQADEDFERALLLNEIRAGRLPVISQPALVLRKGESVHWSEEAQLLEIQTIGRRYVGGSRGISIRVARGVSYRVGSHRGYSVSEKGLVPVSSGELLITGARLIYRGEAKSFELRLDQILKFTMADDGLVITSGKREKPYLLKFDPENSEVIKAVLNECLKRFAA